MGAGEGQFGLGNVTIVVCNGNERPAASDAPIRRPTPFVRSSTMEELIQIVLAMAAAVDKAMNKITESRRMKTTLIAVTSLLVAGFACVGDEEAPPAALSYRAMCQIAQLGAADTKDNTNQVVRLSVRSTLPDVRSRDIRMWIDARSGRVPLPISTNGVVSFAISPSLPEQNPPVVANQPKGSMTIEACVPSGLGLSAISSAGDIHDAALTGDVGRMRRLLKADPTLTKVQNPSYSDATPLHLAAMNGHLEVVAVLLDGGAEVDARDCGGWTPLMRAVANQRTNVVESLLARKAPVNSAMGIGRTALHYAVMADDTNIVALLLSYNADVNAGSGTEYDPPPLHLARTTAMVELLLASKANIEAINQSGETALHKAALFNSTAIAKVLILHKADINAKDRSGRTPLHWAAWRNSVDAAKLLLDNGANVAIRDQEGSTPLGIATKRGYKDMRVLLERYASN